MSLLSLDHICIDVSDMERAKDFYVNKLGCTEYSQANVQGKIQTVFLQSGGVMIDLKCLVDGKVTAKPDVEGFHPRINHIAIKTDDIKKTHQELVERGVQFKREPKYMAHSDRWIAIFEDPDGNCFHLTQ